MKHIKDIEEIVGETVTKVMQNPYSDVPLALFFNNSYIVIRTRDTYDNDPRVEVVNSDLDINAQKILGLITQDEYDKQFESARQSNRDKAEHEQFQLYLKLREKYEDRLHG